MEALLEDEARGTVTFLFTDIEASTRKWERDAPVMSRDLRRHDLLLRGGIEAGRGRVFKTVGDAFCASFDDPVDAVQAAVAIQLSLAAEPWETPGGILVRMCLHAGPAERRDGDWFGTTLNRTARILSLAFGGQILVSLAVAELVADHLPPGLGLLTLGQFRLKDLSRGEILAQVKAEGLRERFPPLKSLDGRPHNLPLEPTPFVAREGELVAILRLFSEPSCRLVSLVGPGGVGKTRLAVQAGAELLDEFSGGVWFVDLSACRDAGASGREVAEALGVREAAGEGTVAALRAWIGGQRLLLILDNLEQDEGVGGFIAELLSACPRLCALGTSRNALGSRWERQLAVRPLPLPPEGTPPLAAALAQFEAVSLFIERAAAARPGFRVDERNAPAVAAICALLDGIPLAIELAAARLRSFGPEALLERLRKDLGFLDSALPDLPARQRGLRAVAAWSCGLLGREARTAFAALGVFHGSFGLEAAEAVLGAAVKGSAGSAKAAILLSSLVDASLVSVEEGEGETRYRLLGTLRAYARELLARSSAEGAAREAWLGRQLRLAEPACSGPPGGPADPASLRLAWAERADRQAAFEELLAQGRGTEALRLALSQARTWALRALVEEGRAWLEAALAAAPDAPAALRARGLLHLGRLLRVGGSPEEADARYAEALALFEGPELAGSEARGSALCQVGRAWAAYLGGRSADARLLFSRALGRVEGAGGEEEAEARYGLGSLALAEGRKGEARVELGRALVLAEGAGLPAAASRAASSLAMLALRAGDNGRAAELFTRAAEHFREIGDRPDELATRNNLACVEQSEGRHEEAAAILLEVERCAREAGLGRIAATALLGRSDSLRALGRREEARAAAEGAVRELRELEARPELGQALRRLACIDEERGARPEAQRSLAEALGILEDAGDCEELAEARALEATLRESRGPGPAPKFEKAEENA